MPHTVNVAGLSSTTTQDHLHDFFTFCGKIEKIDFHGSTASIHFEKSSAAKTALMLNGGTLDGAALTVTADKEHEDDHTEDGHPIQQSDKPRAGIAAEYLAKGYILGDTVLKRAIEIDTKQGISKKFLAYLNSVDTTVGSKTLGEGKTISGKATETITAATQQARALDEQKGYSKTATDYYSKALASPFGARVRDFYTSTSKQVFDIHEEAKRIHAEQTGAAAPAAAPATEAVVEKPVA
ncbi:RRM domain-containing protein [Mycena chlorophos]|uniref:RRM domain-containing protein n=1 Tax=Mycena chlorophos TaxID=658473 RepID=A0A8H6VYI2_MYCCL|nr:RRM domain-containing protein [Mycena chlorophos]